MHSIDIDKVEHIIDHYRNEKGSLIQILLDVQKQYNWLPPETLKVVGDRLDIPITRILRVATFYKALSLEPRGKHLVKVCLGTACHVRGGVRVMERLGQLMGIEEGKTTEDMKFTLEKINCLGCCALGPIVTVDDEYYGKMTPEKVPEALEKYQQ
ncbi:MAG: NADH-quinone oxidoreductase subunit NuoE [Thermodesulfobacteriota bacterium]|nr:NADH-quinone oxidoreductase subunit NuoE [Thermodesulfobacteriota bacterium]